MSHKPGAPAIQHKSFTCLHRLLNDAHNSTSAVQNKAVQRRQQLRLAFSSVLTRIQKIPVLASRLQTDVEVAP